jgi:hypothetical protein
MLFNLYGHYVQQQKALKELHNETKKKEDKAWLFSLKSKPSLNMDKKGRKRRRREKHDKELRAIRAITNNIKSEQAYRRYVTS